MKLTTPAILVIVGCQVVVAVIFGFELMIWLSVGKEREEKSSYAFPISGPLSFRFSASLLFAATSLEVQNLRYAEPVFSVAVQTLPLFNSNECIFNFQLM